MSAKKPLKETKTILLIAVIIALLILATASSLIITSCVQQKQRAPIFLNITAKETATESDQTNSNASTNTTSPVITENADEQQATEESQPEPSIPARANQVEFYFLLKQKTYFQDTLREQQAKLYNVAGQSISIKPVIITNESVIFTIDDYTTKYTTKALNKHDSDSNDVFEIYVKEIYYRR
jgi:hypothetical protein